VKNAPFNGALLFIDEPADSGEIVAPETAGSGLSYVPSGGPLPNILQRG
jgi:hypothetical protein